jgi:hypothetical protein
MDLWIQPSAACADLYGQLAAINPQDELTVNGAGNVKDARAEEHDTCGRCCGVFTRILTGPPTRQIWMFLKVGQH